jgi:hypothetical protein
MDNSFLVFSGLYKKSRSPQSPELPQTLDLRRRHHPLKFAADRPATPRVGRRPDASPCAAGDEFLIDAPIRSRRPSEKLDEREVRECWRERARLALVTPGLSLSRAGVAGGILANLTIKAPEWNVVIARDLSANPARFSTRP